MNGHFTEESIQMANKHEKGCSMSLTIRAFQGKTTIVYLYMLNTAKKLKLTIPNATEDTETLDHSHYWQIHKMVQTLQRVFWQFL